MPRAEVTGGRGLRAAASCAIRAAASYVIRAAGFVESI
jgi:hypothetical protein